uniref:MLLT10 histone lysine methyltransferase DOT1L cofactor n=1 Tax=Callorhinchus milii TaxID=7868 RepID=A0A4W3HBW9_CALMI
MVSSGLPADFSNMKEMIGGCCVCSDERGWAENPLVYCDGHGCNVAVHQACYGIVQVPTGPWFCRKCESQERAARVKCELCPHKDGALKRTDNGGWAHVVCALYIPEVQFANVTTMEPIVLQYVPHERFNKTCYICEEQGRESKAATGACMTCNKHGCRQAFHVTCAQLAGLLCEEEGSEADNVKYCGYCKYHFSKLVIWKFSFVQIILYSIDFFVQKQKDRDKFRQKPKKSLDSSSTVPSLTVTTEKTYTSPSSSFMPGSLKRLEETTARFTNVNFQEVSARPSSGNEGSEVKVLEVKGKKTGGHSSGQRGRKPGNGKNSACGPATGSPNSFPQGSLLGTASSVKSPSGSSVQSPQEFQSFTESDLRNDTCVHPQPSSTRETIKGEIVEQEGTLINISPLLNLPSTSSGLSQTNIENSKHSENSHGDYGVSDATAITSSGAPGFKRAQASIMEEETIKEKKRKGSKKYKHGPGRPKGSKNKESISQHSVSSASPSSSSVTSAAGSVASANLQKSPSLLRNGSLQNLSVSSSPAGSGGCLSFEHVPDTQLTKQKIRIYTSNELPVSLQNAAPGTSCSTPISEKILLFISNIFSLMYYGSNSASETNQADQELVDTNRGLPGRSISPRASLSPRSPAGGLQIRYDPSSNNILENLPPVASSIEQLLERQWSEGQQFLVEQGTPGDVMGMLKSLHQLQVENRRLEEQIKNLTAKKERLQLLNAQLSVPFPVTSSTVSPAAQMHTFSSQAVPNPASLHSNKGSHLSNSFLPESSLPVPSQELTSSGQSTSSSSLASPTPIGQSPAQQGSGLIAVQKINSVTGALASGLQTVTSTIPTMSSVGGLMGTLSGNQMAVNGIVGALNGVIQTSESITPSTLSHTAVPPNLTLPLSTSLESTTVTLLNVLPNCSLHELQIIQNLAACVLSHTKLCQLTPPSPGSPSSRNS